MIITYILKRLEREADAHFAAFYFVLLIAFMALLLWAIGPLEWR